MDFIQATLLRNEICGILTEFNILFKITVVLSPIHCAVVLHCNCQCWVSLQHVPLAQLSQVPQHHLHMVCIFYSDIPRLMSSKERQRDLYELQLVSVDPKVSLDMVPEHAVESLHLSFCKL